MKTRKYLNVVHSDVHGMHTDKYLYLDNYIHCLAVFKGWQMMVNVMAILQYGHTSIFSICVLPACLFIGRVYDVFTLLWSCECISSVIFDVDKL